MRRPEDQEPEPPGGRAAERLREFIDERYPHGLEPAGDRPDEATDPTDSDEKPVDHPHPEDRS